MQFEISLICYSLTAPRFIFSGDLAAALWIYPKGAVNLCSQIDEAESTLLCFCGQNIVIGFAIRKTENLELRTRYQTRGKAMVSGRSHIGVWRNCAASRLHEMLCRFDSQAGSYWRCLRARGDALVLAASAL
jgi:hypothetical protein